MVGGNRSAEAAVLRQMAACSGLRQNRAEARDCTANDSEDASCLVVVVVVVVGGGGGADAAGGGAGAGEWRRLEMYRLRRDIGGTI